MSMDNIQLKQEDFVKNDVVLSDINPITNTASINDSASGEKLQKTLEMIWSSINNKLTRVVNSVNGRTGVVVLSSEDVGLGNVDNVSFTDIKEWLIDRLEQALRDKRLYLFDTMAEVDAIVDLNDESYSWAPFFCETKDGRFGNEQKSCIGVFTWDATTGQLGKEYMDINTLGFGKVKDNELGSPSIIYDQAVEKTNGVIIDMTGGGIAVNIHKDEDALYIDSSGTTKSDQGLRIDKSRITSRFFFVDGVYGYNNTYAWSTPVRGYFDETTQKFYKNYDSSTSTYSVEIVGDATKLYIENRENPAGYYKSYKYIPVSTDNRIAYWMYNRNIPVSDITSGRDHVWGGIQSSDSMLAWASIREDDPECTIIIDDISYTVNLNKEWLAINDIRKNDIIMCNFMFDKYVYMYNQYKNLAFFDDMKNIIPQGMDVAFFDLQPAIGTVSSAPDANNPGYPYEITFRSIRTNADGFGLGYVNNHGYDGSDETKAKSQLKINLASYTSDNRNYSGMNTFQGYFNPSTGIRESQDYPDGARVIIDMLGSVSHTNNKTPISDGLTITSDDTICTFSEKHYVPGLTESWSSILGDPTKKLATYYDPYDGDGKDKFLGSKDVLNYSWPTIPGNYQDICTIDGYGVTGYTTSRLSVKRNTIVWHPYPDPDSSPEVNREFKNFINLTNISGLKLQQSTSKNSFKTDDTHSETRGDDYFLDKLGMPDKCDTYGKYMENIPVVAESGGLSVNIGRFLEIQPKLENLAENFEDSGKINVRIGNGLTETEGYVEVPYTQSTGKYDITQSEYMNHINEFAWKFVAAGDTPDVPLQYLSVYWTPLYSETPPDDWDTNWWKYGFTTNPSIMAIIDGGAPHYSSGNTRTFLERIVHFIPKNNPPKFTKTNPSYYKREGDAGSYTYVPLTEMPYDWYSDCTKYFKETYTGSGTYVNVQPQAPEYVPADLAIYYTWRYYRRVFEPNEPALYDIDWLSGNHNNIKLYRLKKSNRISLNIDTNTLKFTEDGKLTLVEAEDPGTHSGRNLRISDIRGCYFDTNNTELNNLEEPVEGFINLGKGLKVVGGKIARSIDASPVLLKSYILDSLGISGANLTTADCIGIYIKHRNLEELSASTPDSDFLTVKLVNVGPFGAGDIYNAVNNGPTRLGSIRRYYNEMMAGLALSDGIVNEDIDTRSYLLMPVAWISQRINSIIEIVKYKQESERFNLFTMIKNHYDLNITFSRTDPVDEILNKFRSCGSSWVIFDYNNAEDQYPMDWLFNDFVTILNITPDEDGTMPSTTYIMLHSKPYDWSTNPTSYYTSTIVRGYYVFSEGALYASRYIDDNNEYVYTDPITYENGKTYYSLTPTTDGKYKRVLYGIGDPNRWTLAGNGLTEEEIYSTDNTTYSSVEWERPGVAPTFKDYTYFTTRLVPTSATMYPLTEEPSDWITNFTSYFTSNLIRGYYDDSTGKIYYHYDESTDTYSVEIPFDTEQVVTFADLRPTNPADPSSITNASIEAIMAGYKYPTYQYSPIGHRWGLAGNFTESVLYEEWTDFEKLTGTTAPEFIAYKYYGSTSL